MSYVLTQGLDLDAQDLAGVAGEIGIAGLRGRHERGGHRIRGSGRLPASHREQRRALFVDAQGWLQSWPRWAILQRRVEVHAAGHAETTSPRSCRAGGERVRRPSAGSEPDPTVGPRHGRRPKVLAAT
jgi:hypothetical protein